MNKIIIFQITSTKIFTDGDFGFEQKSLNLNKKENLSGLSINYEMQNKNAEYSPKFQVKQVDQDGYCYKFLDFKFSYKYDDIIKDRWDTNKEHPALEFAQFISWHMIKLIHGRYFDIDGYIEFFADLILKFKSYDNELKELHEEYNFSGNADGIIYVDFIIKDAQGE